MDRPKNFHRIWTKEEDEYLTEKLGIFSYNGIAKVLKRSPSAVENRRKRLGLCQPKDADGLITVNYLAECINIDAKTIRIAWIKKYNFQVSIRNVAHNRKLTRIKISYFWKWAKEHQELIKWDKFKVGNLGVEPEWVAKVRENYKNPKRFYRQWTNEEIELLKSYYKLGISVEIIAKNLNRTVQAVRARAVMVDVKRKEPQNWKLSDRDTLFKLLKEGYTAKEIAQKMNRTERSVTNAKYRYKIGV